MKVKNKKIINSLGIVLLTILTASSAFSQNDEKDSKDHPLISRFPGSSIMVYDMKDFNDYVVPLGKMEKGNLNKRQKLEEL